MRARAVSRPVDHEASDESRIHGPIRGKGEEFLLEADQAELEEPLGGGDHAEEPSAKVGLQPAGGTVERGESKIA